jgi:hypothetical protein
MVAGEHFLVVVQVEGNVVREMSPIRGIDKAVN